MARSLLYEAVLREAVSDFDDREERQAATWAKRKHDDTGARRKFSGEPYWVHPEGCAKIAKAYGASKQEILACMAHDTVEDAGATLDDIKERFGEEVARIVGEVTNDDAAIARYGKEEYLNDKLRYMSSPAFTVKLCDNFFNVTDKPKPEQKSRIISNVKHAVRTRSKITPVQKSLIVAIASAVG